MSDWTHGYVADVSYDYSFFPELSPIQMGFNLLDAQVLPPALDRFNYCELGCGQGFTTNVLAATHPQAEFWGVDFNPTHAAEAQRLADSANLKNIRFLDQSFAEFLETDTPPFDFITLHGVYSWIGDANRMLIVDLLRRKLKFGGTVYISYNALPGWSALLPLRDLMVQHTQGKRLSSLQKVEEGLSFARKLQDLKAGYFVENPTVKHDLNEIQNDSRNYLAHEYFNGDSQPFYHCDMVEHLATAKLSFVSSADIDDVFYNLRLNQEQLGCLNEISDKALQETTRDFFFNSRFRRDLFVRGPVHLPALEQVELLSHFRFALAVPPEEVDYEPELVGRSIKLDQALYESLVTALAVQPQTLRQLMSKQVLKAFDFSSILQALKILLVTDVLKLALSEDQEELRYQAIADLNTAILKRSRFGADTQLLVSPVIGNGIDINRAEQLFLLAHQRQVDPVSFIWTILKVQGEKLMKDGVVLETPEENIAELTIQAQEFTEHRLPFLQYLGIV